MARFLPLVFLPIAALAGLALANGETPVESPPAPSGNPPPAPAVSGVHALAGSMSCAAQGCHGRLDPIPHQPLTRNEATTWFARDPHANAYDILKGERSVQMAGLLNGPGKPAHLDARCLACHANPEVARFAAEHQKELWGNPRMARDVDLAATKGTGVGCESCHTSPGHATGEYLTRHVDWGPTALGLDTWKQPGKLRQWQTAGLRPLSQPGELAKLCSSCHVGSPGNSTEPLRDCHHDIMAAGHPRLVFDAATYLSQLPSHWNAGQYQDQDSRMASVHWVGQVAAARQVVALSAFHARKAGGPWPEFSDMDCFSCHAGLEPTGDSWRRLGRLAGKADAPTKPGQFMAFRLPLGVTATLAAKPELSMALEAWAKAIGKGKAAEVARSADSLMVEFEKWGLETGGFETMSPGRRSEMLGRLGVPAGLALENGRWDEAESYTLSLYWLSRGIMKAPEKPMFDKAFAALAFPRGYEGPKGTQGGDRILALKNLAAWARKQAGK